MIEQTTQKPILFLASEHPALDFAELLAGAQFVVAETVYSVVKDAHQFSDNDRLEAIVVGSISQDDPFSMRVVYRDESDESREYFFKLVSVGDKLARTQAGFSQAKREGNLTLALMSVPQSIDELYRVLAAMTREHFGGWIVRTYEQAQRVDFSEWEIKLYASDEMRSRLGQIYCICSVTYEAFHKATSSLVSRLDDERSFLVEPFVAPVEQKQQETKSLYDLQAVGELLFVQSKPRIYLNRQTKTLYFEKRLRETALLMGLNQQQLALIEFEIDSRLSSDCFDFRDERDNQIYRAYFHD